MHPSHNDNSSAREGNIVIIGSLVHRRPWFPSRLERASLVARALPLWAVASGITAGWVWTGMGHPEPWSVLREEKPGLSPLERTAWRARVRSHHHEVTTVAGLRLLTPACAVREILLSGDDTDVCASQVAMMSNHSIGALLTAATQRRASAVNRAHANGVLERVKQLRVNYPDITR
jgi:hypothetical protein